MIIVALSALVVWASSLAHAQGPTPKSRAVLTLDKNEFFLGENVLVHYCFENLSADPIKISFGSDYRGASRSLRFRVTVTDTAGRAMPDPDPSGYSLGGIGSSQEMTRGQRWCQSLPLMRYARIDGPGSYEVRVLHDLGLPAGEAPEGRVTIRLLSPTEAQAEQVVAKMVALPRDSGTTMGRLSSPYADFSALRYGVYLQPLLRRAQEGDTTAARAIGSIPTPEATKALVAMLEGADVAMARVVAGTLNARLPDPELDGTLERRSPFANDMKSARQYLIEASWRDEFAPDVRAAASRFLTSNESEDVVIGAFMLEAVGGPQAEPVLAAALTRAIEKTLTLPFESSGYPRPRGSVQELMRAADILVRRGYAPGDSADTPGNVALWLVAFGQGARPARWQESVSRALAHPIPYIRELAMDRMPPDVSANFAPAIRANLDSTDLDVQIAACNLAGRGMLSAIRGAVSETFRKAKETWTLRTCGNALYALNARFERADILASRLTEPDVAEEVFSSLLGLFETDGYSSCCLLDEATALAPRWKSFIAAHRADIEAGREISLDEPDVTRDLVPAGVTLHRTGKPDWPVQR